MPGEWTERELIVGGSAVWQRERREVGGARELTALWERLPSPERLYSNLQLVYRIGPWREARLRRQGIGDLRELVHDPRWQSATVPVLRAIEKRDLNELSTRGAESLELLGFFTPRDILFLDLETAGLSPLMPVFLAGVAFIDGDDLLLRQYFARSYEEEEPLVRAVNSLLAQYPVVVTYNGRSFDQPYLIRRALITQSPCRWSAWHVDLLPLTRRYFRGDLPDFRLVTVSEWLLGRSRADDIPGSLVPSLYHQFVAEGDWLTIEPVLNHNAEDLLALAFLLQRLVAFATQLAGPASCTAHPGLPQGYGERTGTE
ncbi:MAG: ribonuclease H-like domain-containing protein [Limnochordales bacterium]|nr:ribonuclease H-like domain-containing protein [Limnochordales bacterium]